MARLPWRSRARYLDYIDANNITRISLYITFTFVVPIALQEVSAAAVFTVTIVFCSFTPLAPLVN